jgi:hypothetical protein
VALTEATLVPFFDPFNLMDNKLKLMWNLTFAALLCVLVACAQPNGSSLAGTSSMRPESGLTREFRTCYAESKKIWLVAVVAELEAGVDQTDRLISDFVGSAPDEVRRAKSYLSAQREGRYADAEIMAASVFDACMQRFAAQQVNPGRSTRCFREQRISFLISHMRQEEKLNAEQATNKLLRQSPKHEHFSESTVRRLVRDHYKINTSGGTPAYAEAQFDLCMNVYRYD